MLNKLIVGMDAILKERKGEEGRTYITWILDEDTCRREGKGREAGERHREIEREEEIYLPGQVTEQTKISRHQNMDQERMHCPHLKSIRMSEKEVTRR